MPHNDPPTALLVGWGEIVHARLDDLNGASLGHLKEADVQAIAFDHRGRRVCWVTKRYMGTTSESYVECTQIEPHGAFSNSREWIRPAFAVDGQSTISAGKNPPEKF